MNGQDILDALSGIDPKYIDEAAYELKETGSVVDITSVNRRRNARKLLYVVLPSVAAILLIVAVALPAVLRVSKSESASMSEAPAAASEAAAPAEDAAMADEAPAMTEDAEAPAMAEEAEAVDEAPALDTNGAQSYKRTEGETAKSESSEEAVAEAAQASEAAPAALWQMTEATYENGILTVDLAGEVPEDILEKDYYLIAQDPASTQEDILGAPLADITGKDALKDGHLVLDLSKLKLQKGAYVIEIEGVWVRFEVK